MVTQHIILDMTPGTKPIVNVSQYDTGARTLVFHLRQNRQAFTPPDGCTAIIHGIKPDSTYFSYAAEIDGDIVVADCTEQMTACVGFAECEVRLSNTEGHVGSANFLLNCEKSPMTGAVISESVIAAAEQLATRAEQAAATAISAEQGATESAEAAAESATNAGESADRAAREAEIASQAAEEAGESALSAANSASSASGSEASARGFAEQAEQSAGEASESAQGATQASQTASAKASESAASADRASGSAVDSANAANLASGYADTARTQAQAAETSATNAAGSASTASQAAGTATQKAGEASQSATAAGTSASQAAASATAANTSAENASASASAAATSAGSASDSATAAAGSASDASDSAASAAASASAAAQSASDIAASAAQIQTNADSIVDLENRKANIDGYYEDLTAGNAEQLISSQYVEDSTPYLFRTTGGSADVGNREYLEKIVGGTVAWNQLVFRVNTSTEVYGITRTLVKDGYVRVSGTSTNRTNFTVASFGASIPAVHVYLFDLNGSGIPSGCTLNMNVNATASVVKIVNSMASFGIVIPVGTTIDTVLAPQCFDLTAMFGSAIADYIYSLEQATAGAGVAFFRKLFPEDYYPYDTGTLKSVEGVSAHEMVGFNQFNKSSATENATINSAGAVVAGLHYVSDFIKVMPFTDYYVHNIVSENNGRGVVAYDSQKNLLTVLIPGLTSAVSGIITTPSNAVYLRIMTDAVDSCSINLSHNGSRNGEYELYVKHSYPLDSSLTLRGIPKLDASNNLYYDGDTYESDGTVTRKYGIVDLGTLDWVYDTSWNSGTFRAPLYTMANVASTNNANILCPKYETRSANNVYSKVADKIVCQNSVYVRVYDTSFTDAASFKAAMSGVMLVYELATPTTEQAEPYRQAQICDDWGTEEFISAGMVPVGHDTKYPANLRDKLQHLPDLAFSDGWYIVRQSGSQMSLEAFPIPTPPTDAGTYTLKATVSGGTVTYTWEAETEVET